MPETASTPEPLGRFLWLSLAAAVSTLGIKMGAAWLTNSVSLWSDALESTVNLAAALVAIWAMHVAVKPADEDHDFGHGKAEYLSAGVEGAMIFVAAAGIVYSAVERLVAPQATQQLDVGIGLSVAASLINLAVGWTLVRAGRRRRSITLEADGKHLLTDVLTTLGVIVGIGLVMLTGWHILDPIVAIAVGLNILWTGYRLVRRSLIGLLDAALPPGEVATITEALSDVAQDPRVSLTELRTRESGRQRFVYATMSVPGHWTVRRSHEVADTIEDTVARLLPGAITFVHIEPNNLPPTSQVPLESYRHDQAPPPEPDAAARR